MLTFTNSASRFIQVLTEKKKKKEHTKATFGTYLREEMKRRWRGGGEGKINRTNKTIYQHEPGASQVTSGQSLGHFPKCSQSLKRRGNRPDLSLYSGSLIFTAL